ncbi:MAG: hypothetical protein ACRYF3_07750 [Janthinobacterium lividum]
MSDESGSTADGYPEKPTTRLPTGPDDRAFRGRVGSAHGYALQAATGA